MEEDPAKAIKKECLRLLTRREHSRKEIEQKLATKGFAAETVAPILDELAAKHWQNDTRYAENYARVRSQKGFGPVRIAYELQQKGIESAEIAQQMQSASQNWLDQIALACRNKYADPGALSPAERAKCIRFLLQRGFSSAMINAFFKQSTHQST